MKTSQRGFVGALLLVLIVLLAGGVYVYVHTKSVSHPVVTNSQTSNPGPKGILLPSTCKVIGSNGYVEPLSMNRVIPNGHVLGENEWFVDCGSQNNNAARATLGPVLKNQGWILCDSGLATASWWKDGVITGVAEGVSRAGFTVSQSYDVPGCQ
jgi:hypothetical protein